MKKIKKAIKIIVIVMIVFIILTPFSILFLNQEMACYESKLDDGYVIRTRYGVIKDYFNGVRYEEIKRSREW